MSLGRVGLGLLTLGLLVGLVAQVVATRQVRRELAEVRESLGRLEAQAAETNAALDVLKALAHSQRTAGGDLGLRPYPAPRLQAPTSGEAATHTATSPPASEELQRLIDRKVDEKLRANQKNATGDRKLPLGELVKELGLDPGTEERVAEIANAAKKQILEVTRTPRADGTSLADDLIDAFMKGDEKGTRALFARAFTEKVPGSDLTYAAMVGRIQDRARQGLETHLSPDAYRRFRGMDVKPENVETGFDPWAEYAQKRAAK
jgi:hypothetical protein